VRVVDLDGSLFDLDLRGASDPPYRRVLVVGRSRGRVVGAEVFEVPASGAVSTHEIAVRFGPRPPRLETAAPARGSIETEPDTTVVITTCGGDLARLQKCLESVRGQTRPPLEIVVVNNRPKLAGLSRALVDLCAGRPGLRCIEESRPGLSRARNAGLRAAGGKYVAFLDDDVVADTRWLAAARQRFTDHDDVACVTGLILPDELATPAQVLFERFAGFGKGFEVRVYNAKRPPSDDPLFPYTAGQFGSGANCMFDRSALLDLAGFDPVLGAGTPAAGGEDLDMFLRIVAAGHTLVYEPGAMVWHRHPRTYEEFRARAYSYGVGLGAMLTKQALFARDRLSLWRKAPLGLWYLLNPQSEKNRRKEEHFPIALTVRELLGFCAGPYAYLRSRARSRNAYGKPRGVTSGDGNGVVEVDLRKNT
jgi:GT2 family glycosyltransferase